MSRNGTARLPLGDDVIRPTFARERYAMKRGLFPIAGCDEAGRGPLAGPVVAAAVVLPEVWRREGLPQELEGLNDSKQLTLAQRERFFLVLTTRPEIHFAIARMEAAQVDEWNILQATHRAMNEALGNGGTCYGDSGGPNFLGSTTVLAATTITGDAVCRATNVVYRLDTPGARTFLAQFVTLP